MLLLTPETNTKEVENLNIRYQVFISSTFEDLEKERKILSQTLLKKGCYPAGMEWFPAVDEEQFEYIKQVIDDTDYYIIVLGGLYGTISPDGKSYTEKEYDYAVEKGKRIIALVQKEPTQNETDDDRKIKFLKFKRKVTSSRLVNFWTKPEELSGLLAISLDQTILKYPSQGWIRCDSDKCDARLQFIDINSAIPLLKFDRLEKIHVMASGTSTYIPIIKSLLKNSENKRSIHIYIHFRLGANNERISLLKNQYDIWWNHLKKEYPQIKLHFSCEKDFQSSFRGVIINQRIGLVGFYVRLNNTTIGTMDNCMLVDKNTDVGRYIINCFLKCFQGQREFQTIKACIENSN